MSADIDATTGQTGRLETLLADCEARVAALDLAHAREMNKPLLRRRRMILVFIERERAVYSFGVELLKSLRSG